MWLWTTITITSNKSLKTVHVWIKFWKHCLQRTFIWHKWLSTFCSRLRVITTSSWWRCTRQEIFLLCRCNILTSWIVHILTSCCHWFSLNTNFTKYFHCQDDKSTWTKIESTSSDMVTRFVSIKGEKTDAKDGFRDLPVKEAKERVALFLKTIPDYPSGLLFPWRRKLKAVQLLHNIKLHVGVLLEGEFSLYASQVFSYIPLKCPGSRKPLRLSSLEHSVRRRLLNVLGRR